MHRCFNLYVSVCEWEWVLHVCLCIPIACCKSLNSCVCVCLFSGAVCEQVGGKEVLMYLKKVHDSTGKQAKCRCIRLYTRNSCTAVRISMAIPWFIGPHLPLLVLLRRMRGIHSAIRRSLHGRNHRAAAATGGDLRHHITQQFPQHIFRLGDRNFQAARLLPSSQGKWLVFLCRLMVYNMEVSINRGTPIAWWFII